MPIVREDRYGPYVKNDGSIVRPVLTQETRGYNIMPGATNNAMGSKVKAKHYGGSTLHEVGGEMWAGHGCYYDSEGRQLSSEECWTPL